MQGAPTHRNPTFAAAMRFVLRFEGGFVDHPADPGGATNHGVSLRFARSLGRLVDLDRDGDVDAADIRLVTPEFAAGIYHAQFWFPVRGADLPPALAVTAFDAAINCGAPRAARWLQAAVGVAQDGAIGARSLAAAAKADQPRAVAEMLALRSVHNAGQPTWPSFGLGWSRRIAALALFAATFLPPEEPAR